MKACLEVANIQVLSYNEKSPGEEGFFLLESWRIDELRGSCMVEP
jgi:hypothetical protein